MVGFVPRANIGVVCVLIITDISSWYNLNVSDGTAVANLARAVAQNIFRRGICDASF